MIGKRYLNPRVVTFGISQVLILLSGLARFPIITNATNLKVFASYVLYTSLLSAVPVFVAGRVNSARIAATLGEFQVRTTGSSRFAKWAATGGFIVSLLLAIDEQLIFWSPIFLIIGIYFVIYFLAPAVGFQLGKEKYAMQNLFQAGGSVIGLVSVVVAIYADSWHKLPESRQVFILTITSAISTVFAYVSSALVNRVQQRSHLNTQFLANGESALPSNMFLEGLAALPPALLTFLDTTVLQIFSNNYQLALYGLTQKTSALATFMTGANAAKISNDVIAGGKISNRGLFRASMLANFTNLPFLASFVIFSPLLTAFLSSGKLKIDWSLVIAFVFYSILQPFWLVFSNAYLRHRGSQLVLGKYVLGFVLPASLLSTVVGAMYFHAAGVVYASTLSYLLAVLIAYKLGLRHER